MGTFKNPPPEYRGTELYMLNDKLEKAELDRQIGGMKKQGFSSFIARTYVGHKSDYPGREFHERIADIVGVCKKQGMQVFLQAGYMPGGVADLPEEYAHTGIRPVPPGETPEHRVRILQSRGGVDYSLIRAPFFLDMLGKDAVRYYAQKSYEEMWAEFREEFGRTVVSVWVDEPHFRPPDLPWTAELPETFNRMWGYDLLDKLYLLYERGEGWQTVRYQYWRTVLRLLQDGYFKEISGWCRKNGLWFSGHLMGEDTLFHQISLTCDCMPLYKYFDIPGIDFLTCDLDWRHGMQRGQKDNYLFVNTPLQCVSAAHQAGRSRILCEMFGVSKQNLTFADQRFIFDFFAAQGINHKMAHGVFYSLRGRGKRAYPPHINYYQPYWEDYHLVNDYFARTSWFISQGRPVADILVVHPVETGFSRYENTGAPVFDDYDRSFNELLQRLLAVHASFELGDEETIAECGAVRDGCFVVGEMSYRTVVLPDLGVLRETTLALLENFASRGGRVILQGAPPALLDGVPFDPGRLLALPGLLRVHNSMELARLFTDSGHAPYTVVCQEDGSSVFVNVRRLENGYHLFAFNMDRGRGRNITITVPGTFGALRCRGETGGQHPWPALVRQDRTSVGLELEPGGSMMILLDERAAPVSEEKAAPWKTIEVRGGFRRCRKAPNVLTLDTARFRKGGGPWSAPYPVLAIHHLLRDEAYEGEVSLAFTVVGNDVLTGLCLAVENPGQIKAFFNDVPVDMTPGAYYCDRSFETVRLPDVMKQGDNTLVLIRHFVSPGKPKTDYSALYENLGGVELESVYLLGDFAVRTIPEKTSTGCVRLSPLFTLCRDEDSPGAELVTNGYPFYAGTMVYTKTVLLPETPQGKAELHLLGFNGCVARIMVNGKEAEPVCWLPHRTDVTGLFSAGENVVVIEITNSLRNLLGPYHRPAGEPGYCWGNYASPDGPWMGDFDFESPGGRVRDWYDHRTPDNPRWTESYLQVPFGLAGFRIQYR